jgi:hypothetical protein
LTNKKLIVGLLGLNLLFVSVLVFVPMSFSALTQNKLLAKNSTFQVENVIHPKPNTKEKLDFNKVSKGNLNYYSPINTELFWITGNGNLPCVNQKQLDYFETNFHVISQLRGKTLSEGFYAQKTKAND